MSVYMILMVAGLTGLVLMALPGLLAHGHSSHGAHDLHGSHHVPLPGNSAGALTHAAHDLPADVGNGGGHDAANGPELPRFLPSPRMIFSMMALVGAFGNLFTRSFHLSALPAALAALGLAGLVERFAIRPLWNLLFQFQGQPDTPLQHLILTEAKAITPFTNGKGLVQVVRDGRVVQFSARLIEPHAAHPVRVGDTLCVESVDATNERLTVSIR